MPKPEAEPRQTFVDREEYLSTLQEALTRVTESGSGHAVFVSGPPGIGKTSLLWRFLEGIDPEEAFVFRASGREFAASPFVVLAELFEDINRGHQTRYGRQVALAVLNMAQLLPAFGPYASAASGMVRDLHGLSDADSKLISNSSYVKSMFVSLMEKLSGRKPVVAVLDDAQWSDSSSLEVLGYVINSISRLRMLAIICSRRGYPASEREEDNAETIDGIFRSAPPGTVRAVDVEPLSREYSAELVDDLLKGNRSGGGEILVKRGEGNPLFIKKLALELLSAPGAYGPQAALEKTIPGTIREAISRQLLRIEREDHGARLTLDYAAVMGRTFQVSELADIMKVDPIGLKHTLETLESVYGIVKASATLDAYEFDHELTREAIERQLGSLARSLHMRAGEYYESQKKPDHELIARHFESAGAYAPALAEYRLAAEGSRKSYSFADSVRYLSKCVSMIEEGRVKASAKTLKGFTLALAEAQFSDGLFDDAFRNAVVVTKAKPASGKLLPDALLLAGRCTRYLGVADAGAEGISYLKRAATLYAKMNDTRSLAATYSVLSTVLNHYGYDKEAVAYFGKCQKALNLARDRIGLAVLQRKSGMIYDSRRAIPYIRNALGVFEKARSAIETARCYNNLGAEQFYLADFDSAEDSLLRSVEGYRKIDLYEIDAPLNNLGLVNMQVGRLADARALLEEAQVRASENFNRICSASNLATLDRLEGRTPEALERLSAIQPTVEESGESLIQDYFAFNLATTLLGAGRAEEALSWLERYPLNAWKDDTELANAKRLKAKGAILRALNDKEKALDCLKRAAAILDTRRPQRWFYELDYYPCDIHLLD